MSEPEPYDHVRASGQTIAEGTYRVVGAGEDGVTLLRVTDASGRRVNSGRVVSVSRKEYAALPAAENPDDEGALRRWAFVGLAALLFAVSFSPTAAALVGVSPSMLRTVVVALIAVDVADRLL